MKNGHSWGVLYTLATMLIAAISTWIVGLRMHRRIRRALGRDVKSETELTSLNTWINVEDTEERTRGGKLR